MLTYTPVTGEKVWFLERARDWAVEFGQIELSLAPGGSPPPEHVHEHQTEIYAVLDGTLAETSMATRSGKRPVRNSPSSEGLHTSVVMGPRANFASGARFVLPAASTRCLRGFMASRVTGKPTTKGCPPLINGSYRS